MYQIENEDIAETAATGALFAFVIYCGLMLLDMGKYLYSQGTVIKITQNTKNSHKRNNILGHNVIVHGCPGRHSSGVVFMFL